MQRNGLQCSAGQVRLAGAARQAHQRATRMAVPVRCAQAGEGRHQIAVAGVGHAGGQWLNLVGRAHQLQAVAQPLHGGAAHEDASLQTVGGAAPSLGALPAHGGEQLVVAGDRRGAGVHQHEAAGAVGVFGHAGRKTALAERGGLLVAGQAGNRNGLAQPLRVGLAQHAAGRHHRGQQAGRNIEQFQQRVVPLQSVDVEQQRARSVAGVGGVYFAAGELPDQPGVDGAKGQLTTFGPGAGAGHVVKQPLQLGTGEVRIKHQPGFLLHPPGMSGGLEFVAAAGGAAVLPDNGRGKRLAGFAVPQHRSFALIGNTDCFYIDSRLFSIDAGQLCFFYTFPGGSKLGGPDFHCVVRDPARLRKMLGKLLLRHCHHAAMAIKQHGPRTGGALVECEDQIHIARLAYSGRQTARQSPPWGPTCNTRK